ncbi:MAG: hypothetical protein ACLQVY_28135 [Limisphaerales bacterium]
MTRNGKIARLPLAINRLPEVQAILAAHFAAKPIDESNLTHWRQGGYLDKRNSSAFAKSLASVPSTALPPRRKACSHRNPNLIELN